MRNVHACFTRPRFFSVAHCAVAIFIIMAAWFCMPTGQLVEASVSVDTLASQCHSGKQKACNELAKVALEDKDPSIRSAAVAQLTDQAVLAKVALGDADASIRAAAVAKLTDQAVLAKIALGDQDASVRVAAVAKLTDQAVLAKVALGDADASVRAAAVAKLTDPALLAKIAAEDKDPAVRCSALPLDPLVQELRNRAMQGAEFFPPYPPALLARTDVTAEVKEWEGKQSEDASEPPSPPKTQFFTVEGTSVFMLQQEGGAFIASCAIPAADGKTATGGAIWQESNMDPTTGKTFASPPALSGAVWTPRAAVIGTINLAGTGDITASPDFSFDVFKNSPGVIPFANGYAVNLFGQKIEEQGFVDPRARPRGNYVADDGKPLYGRLVRLRSGKLEEIVLGP